MEYFAKSNPPYKLVQHSYDVARRTREYINQFPDGKLENFGTLYKNIDKLGWIAGFLHDVGKGNPAWQKWIHNEIQKDDSLDFLAEWKLHGESDNYYKPNHSAVSAVVSLSILQGNDYSSLCPDEENAIFLSILHHHTSWTPQNMKYKDQINPYIDDIIKTIDSLPEKLFGEFGISSEEAKNGAEYIRRNAEKNDSEKWNKIRRTALILYSGLRQSDWKESSRIKGQNASFPETFEGEDIIKFDSKRSFQRKIDKNSTNKCLLGLAGCGEGKTYSALLWGQKQRDISNINRLIFAMPTQVTTNNLYLNMESSTIPEDKISLYHGATNYIDDLYSEDTTVPEVDRAELYQASVNVTTVDHVMDSLISNYSESPIAFANMLSSGIVFDEIQAYDDYTTQNILACIKQCRKLGIPVYVMSATIPNKIRSEIPYTDQVVSDGEYNNKSREPYVVNVKDCKLDSEAVKEEISSDHDKVMVVKNTVREAQEIANALDDNFDVFYYSSEFSQIDRKKKEEEIKDEFSVSSDKYDETKVLVCTQICEISLDLSSDILISDIAPIDSIFQRCGRLHREGTDYNSKNCSCDDCQNKNIKYEAIIYNSTGHAEAIYPYATSSESEEFKILEKTAEVLDNFNTYTFKKSIEATDNVYKEFPTDYNMHRYELNSEYGDTYFKKREGKFQLRDIKTHRMDVLVGDALDDIKSEIADEVQGQIRVKPSELIKYYKLNSVPIPSYWIQSPDIDTPTRYIKSEGVKLPIYSELDYSYENGVQPPKEIKEPEVEEGDGFI